MNINNLTNILNINIKYTIEIFTEINIYYI